MVLGRKVTLYKDFPREVREGTKIFQVFKVQNVRLGPKGRGIIKVQGEISISARVRFFLSNLDLKNKSLRKFYLSPP